ncbi:MAG: hypothetical protein H0Z24_03555 [Thermosipho sp. (in: Bacteria)]|nr:hypothetical protein [Thermosipho sp. (in: thermotogales)]
MYRKTRLILFILIILSFLSIDIIAFAADTWEYAITNTDTPIYIDETQTSAYIDTTLNEIALPRANLPDLVKLSSDGRFEYAVLTDTGVEIYSFDGTSMVHNTILDIPVTDPLALAQPTPYPNMVIAQGTEVKQYTFDGSNMVEVPALAVAGLTNIVSVSSVDSDTISVLANNQVKTFQFDGSQMTENTILSPSTTLNNPLQIAIDNDYDMAILEENQLRFFNFTGSGLVENPALAITGLNNPKAFSMDNGEIAIIDGNQVKHYSFDGTQMVYNSALSITSGLTAPSSIALRTGSFDRVILDGDTVKYYSWDGSSLVYNPNLSKQITNIVQAGGYITSAQVQSLAVTPTNAVDKVRVTAYHQVPDGTKIEWSVTADGTNWTKRWRVRGTPTGAVAEVTDDNGLTWVPIGDESVTNPGNNNPDLWATVTAGSSIKWKAELSTTDDTVTPKIIANLGTAVRWEVDSQPNPPILDPVPGWFYTTTPTFNWTFSDPDVGDTQTAFQLLIKRQSDNAIVYDTGKVLSSANSFTLPTSYDPTVPGPLYQSGEYSFTVEIRTWDSKDVPSDYSTPEPFNVLAFERPRIAEIVNPPAGQSESILSDPSTHIMITPGLTASALPKAKAGARVTVLVDSVGPINTPAADIASIYYPEGTATIGEASAANPLGSKTNRWTIPFWTDANLDNVPSGTVVKMDVSGTGTVGGVTSFNIPPLADGIIVTEGSVYEDWFVVLQGSN